MIVVDTSVWIDFFAGRAHRPHVRELLALIDADAGIALTDIVLTEILQGLVDDRAVRRVESHLRAFDILGLGGLDDFRNAASLYRRARRRGVTIRSTTDCLIAAVCLREDYAILHHDRDFDQLATVSELRIHQPVS